MNLSDFDTSATFGAKATILGQLHDGRRRYTEFARQLRARNLANEPVYLAKLAMLADERSHFVFSAADTFGAPLDFVDRREIISFFGVLWCEPRNIA